MPQECDNYYVVTKNRIFSKQWSLLVSLVTAPDKSGSCSPWRPRLVLPLLYHSWLLGWLWWLHIMRADWHWAASWGLLYTKMRHRSLNHSHSSDKYLVTWPRQVSRGNPEGSFLCPHKRGQAEWNLLRPYARLWATINNQPAGCQVSEKLCQHSEIQETNRSISFHNENIQGKAWGRPVWFNVTTSKDFSYQKLRGYSRL